MKNTIIVISVLAILIIVFNITLIDFNEFFSEKNIDFKVINSSQEKISSRTLDSLKLELVPYPKTIDMVKKIYPDTKLIVFKAIYDKNKTDIVKNVNELLVGSKADLVIVNDVSQGNSGFQSDFNEVTIYSKTTSLSIPRTSKSNIAHAIINSSVEILNSCN